MTELMLSYQEVLFSPGDVATCTGLSFAMQREWRRQGHLPQDSGPAPLHLFTPRQLAEIRVMLKLRHLGLGPKAALPLAQQAAPSVLYLVLTEQSGGWGVHGDPERAHRYTHAMMHNWDDRVRLIARVGETLYRYGVLADEGFQWLEDRPKAPSEEREVTGQISLPAIAKAIAASLSKPLVNILVPDTFR